MIPLYTQEEWNTTKWRGGRLPMQCELCGKTFYPLKRTIKEAMIKYPNSVRYCSYTCAGKVRQKRISMKCEKCGKNIIKHPYQIRDNHNNFCSRKCATNFQTFKKTIIVHCTYCGKELKRTESIYNNNIEKIFFCNKSCKRFYDNAQQRPFLKGPTLLTFNCEFCGKEVIRHFNQTHRSKHKFCGKSCALKYSHKNGNIKRRNRSQLELWIENELNKKYPNLYIEYNNKTVIGYELDIYIPSLKLAFEINGVLHHKPAFGENHLLMVQVRDSIKKDLCEENNIKLIVIDSLISFNEYEGNRCANVVFENVDQLLF